MTENTHFVYDKKKIQFCDSYLARNSMENHLLLSTFFQLQNDTPIDIYLTSAKKKLCGREMTFHCVCFILNTVQRLLPLCLFRFIYSCVCKCIFLFLFLLLDFCLFANDGVFFLHCFASTFYSMDPIYYVFIFIQRMFYIQNAGM